MSHTAPASTILEIITLHRKTLSKNGKAVVYQLPGAQGILYTTLFTSQAAAPASVDIRVPTGTFKVVDASKAERAAQREAKRAVRLANAETRLQKMLARAAKLQADLDKRKADNPAQPAITVAPVVRGSNAAKDAVVGTTAAKKPAPHVSPLKAARKETSRAKKERRLRGALA